MALDPKLLPTSDLKSIDTFKKNPQVKTFAEMFSLSDDQIAELFNKAREERKGDLAKLDKEEADFAERKAIIKKAKENVGKRHEILNRKRVAALAKDLRNPGPELAEQLKNRQQTRDELQNAPLQLVDVPDDLLPEGYTDWNDVPVSEIVNEEMLHDAEKVANTDERKAELAARREEFKEGLDRNAEEEAKKKAEEEAASTEKSVADKERTRSEGIAAFALLFDMVNGGIKAGDRDMYKDSAKPSPQKKSFDDLYSKISRAARMYMEDGNTDTAKHYKYLLEKADELKYPKTEPSLGGKTKAKGFDSHLSSFSEGHGVINGNNGKFYVVKNDKTNTFDVYAAMDNGNGGYTYDTSRPQGSFDLTDQDPQDVWDAIGRVYGNADVSHTPVHGTEHMFKKRVWDEVDKGYNDVLFDKANEMGTAKKVFEKLGMSPSKLKKLVMKFGGAIAGDEEGTLYRRAGDMPSELLDEKSWTTYRQVADQKVKDFLEGKLDTDKWLAENNDATKLLNTDMQKKDLWTAAKMLGLAPGMLRKALHGNGWKFQDTKDKLGNKYTIMFRPDEQGPQPATQAQTDWGSDKFNPEHMRMYGGATPENINVKHPMSEEQKRKNKMTRIAKQVRDRFSKPEIHQAYDEKTGKYIEVEEPLQGDNLIEKMQTRGVTADELKAMGLPADVLNFNELAQKAAGKETVGDVARLGNANLERHVEDAETSAPNPYKSGARMEYELAKKRNDWDTMGHIDSIRNWEVEKKNNSKKKVTKVKPSILSAVKGIGPGNED